MHASKNSKQKQKLKSFQKLARFDQHSVASIQPASGGLVVAVSELQLVTQLPFSTTPQVDKDAFLRICRLIGGRSLRSILAISATGKHAQAW